MSEHIIADEKELQHGEKMVVQVEGREVGIFNLNNEYYAYTNWCPHQGGPCCEGSVTGTMEASFDRESLDVSLDWTQEDEILNCPWHGWEFEIDTGECLSRNKVKLPAHETEIRDGKIILHL